MDEATSAFPIINDRYQILNTISTGGMSVIYRAKDMILDREIALKILKRDLSQQKDFRDQFTTEAKSTARLSHPNIVTTFDFGFYGDRLFIAMELIDGFLLKSIITDGGISFKQRFQYIVQACKGLAYAHESKIIHCDIKPQNMLVSKAGMLKLTDFGISRALDTISRQSHTEEIWGSPFYIAPEIAKGEPPSLASDVYSLGIVMYELFTKQLPFTGHDVLTLVEKHLVEKPTPPKTINPEIPDILNSIILKTIEKNEKNRYHAAHDLLLALNKVDVLESSDEVQEKEGVSEIVSAVENAEIQVSNQQDVDWKTIILGFLMLILVGGLIPFWLFIYYSINR